MSAPHHILNWRATCGQLRLLVNIIFMKKYARAQVSSKQNMQAVYNSVAKRICQSRSSVKFVRDKKFYDRPVHQSAPGPPTGPTNRLPTSPSTVRPTGSPISPPTGPPTGRTTDQLIGPPICPPIGPTNRPPTSPPSGPSTGSLTGGRSVTIPCTLWTSSSPWSLMHINDILTF